MQVTLPFLILAAIGVGYLADNVRPVLIIVPGLFGRALFTFMYQYVEHPQDPGAYATNTLTMVFTIASGISLSSLFLKDLPQKARGAMSLLFVFFISLVDLAFNLLGGRLHDEIGPAAPFVLCSIIDATLFIIALGLALKGHLDVSEE